MQDRRYFTKWRKYIIAWAVAQSTCPVIESSERKQLAKKSPPSSQENPKQGRI